MAWEGCPWQRPVPECKPACPVTGDLVDPTHLTAHPTYPPALPSRYARVLAGGGGHNGDRARCRADRHRRNPRRVAEACDRHRGTSRHRQVHGLASSSGGCPPSRSASARGATTRGRGGDAVRRRSRVCSANVWTTWRPSCHRRSAGRWMWPCSAPSHNPTLWIRGLLRQPLSPPSVRSVLDIHC